MLSTPRGKPGVVDNFTSIEREVFYGNRQFVQFWPYPATVDGTLSSNPLNTPYVWNLWAGMLMGIETSNGKWRNSIIGLTSASYTSGATSLTVPTAVATEVNRLIGLAGGSIPLTITGPASASTLASSTAATATTCSAASGTTLTITNLGVNVISGSLVQPGDGSQTIQSIQCSQEGLEIVDIVYTNRIDVYAPQLFSGGGTINTGIIVNYPTDPGLRLYIQAALRTNTSGCSFYP